MHLHISPWLSWPPERTPLREIPTSYTALEEALGEQSIAICSTFHIDKRHGSQVLAPKIDMEAGDESSLDDIISSIDGFDDTSRGDSAIDLNWTSLTEEYLVRPSILVLVPSPLFAMPLQDPPPPIPLKSPRRLRRYMESKYQESLRRRPDYGTYFTAKELLKCQRICKTASILVAQSETARKKLWLGPYHQPFESKPHTNQFCLNHLLAVTPYRRGREVTPFMFTKFEYVRTSSTWRLTVWCAVEDLLLRQERSWGRMRLAFSSSGGYEVKVRLFKKGAVIGWLMLGVVAGGNATTVAELMHQILQGDLEHARSLVPVKVRENLAHPETTAPAKLRDDRNASPTAVLHNIPKSRQALRRLPAWPLSVMTCG